MSNLFNHADNIAFSNTFLCINTIDGILFPLSFCIANRIFCNLCNPKYLESSLNSLSDDDDNFMNPDKNYALGPMNSKENENSLAMVDITNENKIGRAHV